MGAVLYAFAATALVIIAGWAIYVLPVQGPLTPLETMVAMLPVFIIMGGVLAILLALYGVLYLVRSLTRRLRR